MVVRDKEIKKRFFAWFLVWYSLEVMLIFFIAFGNWILSENNINAPINVFFIACMGSLIWPIIILLFFITGASLTPVFLLIFGSIVISSITSIIIEYKYNICYPVLFDLLGRIDGLVLNFMKEGILRIFSFWIKSWYFLESVFLILSYIMGWGVFVPLSEEEFPSILSKILVIIMLSLSWPLYMSFITGLFIIGYEGASLSISHLFQPFFWPLYISAFIAFIFTLIMWKSDKIWRIRREENLH